MAKEKEENEDTESSSGGRKKLIIIVVPVVLLLAVVGWWFFLKPDKSGAPEPLPEPVPGAVVQLDPITINLAGAHFLKFGMALQPTAAAKEVDGSKALDLAIGEFSQMTIAELSTTEGRIGAKEELIARIKLTYLPEGTDLATVTSAAGTIEETAKEAAKAELEAKSGTTKSAEELEKEEIHIEELSGAEVIKLAKSLTVQPEIYNLYFTEFVMQ